MIRVENSKNLITKVLLALSKKIFPNTLYPKILFYRASKKFKREINKKKSLQTFSEKLDDINKYEYKITSQNNEDGIIDYLFSKIPNNKKFIEIGFDFYEFNSLNLIKKGWNGKLIEYNKIECLVLSQLIKHYFTNSKVIIQNCKVTKDNINKIINYSDDSQIDFFSLDIDGNDYWILKSLDLNKVKVICCEYNHWLGKDIKKTVPYNANHVYSEEGYYGASLLALNNLLEKKGFDLVAVESSGTNAFFVNKKFSNNFIKLSPIDSWKSGGRFYTPEQKKEIANSIRNFKFLNVD